MRSAYYALLLTGACLAALMLGYAYASAMYEPQEKDLPPEVKYYGTVEAQGTEIPGQHFDTYEEYEAHVLDEIKDKGAK